MLFFDLVVYGIMVLKKTNLFFREIKENSLITISFTCNSGIFASTNQISQRCFAPPPAVKRAQNSALILLSMRNWQSKWDIFHRFAIWFIEVITLSMNMFRFLRLITWENAVYKRVIMEY